MNARDLVRVEQLTVTFSSSRTLWQRRKLHAVRSVDLAIGEGEVVALVGESGSGKTTLGRALLRLIEPSAGKVFFGDVEVTAMPAQALRALRREMQIIYQDPFASLDPRMTVGDIIAEGLQIHRIGTRNDRAVRVTELLAEVGLEPEHARRYPHALSGGQRQRVGISRALAVKPRFIVADEPVSSLDVSIQAQIINLLHELKTRLSLTMLFITHNLGVVRLIADRAAAMYLGRIVEVADTESLFERPAHPYTKTLIASIPLPEPRSKRRAAALHGEPPSPIDPPSGCAFRTRCPIATAECAASVPVLEAVGEGHLAACIHPTIRVREQPAFSGDY